MAKLHSSRATSVVFWVLSCIAILPTLANAFVIRPIAIGLIATVAAITLYCVLLALLRPRIALLVYGLFLVVVFPFDLVSIIGSGEPISYGLLNSIANTSLSETLPQIKPYTAHIAILLLAFVGYFFLLFRYIPRSYRLPKPAIYLSPIAALCVTLVLTLIVAHAHLRSGNYPQKLTGKTSSETARRIAQHTIDEAYLYVSPIRELRLAARFRKDQRRMAKSLSTRPPFPDTLFHRLPNFDTTIIGVLSIGRHLQRRHVHRCGCAYDVLKRLAASDPHMGTRTHSQRNFPRQWPSHGTHLHAGKRLEMEHRQIRPYYRILRHRVGVPLIYLRTHPARYNPHSARYRNV